MYRGKGIKDQIKFLLSFLPQELHVHVSVSVHTWKPIGLQK